MSENIPNVQRPVAVVFDWDNTLIDSWGALIGALNHTLEAMGQAPWPEAEARRRIGRSLREAFPELFGDRWEEARDIYYAAFAERHLDGLRALDGAAGVLEVLEQHRVPCSVVSNKTPGFLHKEAERLGWRERFHRLIGAGDAPHDKPAVDPVHHALAGSGVAPGPDVWFVGDSAVDMACAHAAGCLPVLVNPADPDPEAVRDCPPALAVNGPPDLARHLEAVLAPAAAEA